jgi:hypothetical protein
VTTGRGIVQAGYLVSVVLIPLAVLMMEHLVTEQGMYVVPEERTEGLDGQVDESLEVRVLEGPDVNGGAFRSEGT